jgi:Fe2+ or Zn2+ uptake regulation protein
MGAAASQLCQACGQITEIPGQLLDGLSSILRDRYGFTLGRHRFAITGCCARCR